MIRIKVGDCYTQITENAYIVHPDDGLKDVINKMCENPTSRIVTVVDDEGKLVGVIRVRDILKFVGVKYIQEDTFLLFKTIKDSTASDLMLDPVFVKAEDDIEEALKKSVRSKVNEMPVVDENMIVIGELNCYEILGNIQREWLDE